MAIGASEFPLVALKADGRIVATSVTSPVNFSNAVAVSANRYNGMALRADGTVTNWPSGGPVTPAGLTNVTAIASSQYVCLAILGNGPQPQRSSSPTSFASPTNSASPCPRNTDTSTGWNIKPR